jgi:hypothetical protein
MPSRLSKPLERLRRKLLLAVWLGRMAGQGALVLAIMGGVILLGRVGLGLELEQALWLLLPLAAVPFTAWIGVRKAVPSEEGAAAWLDLRSGAQGLLLTDFEREDERWDSRMDEQIDRLPELPPIKILAFGRLFLPAIGFALLALFVPLSQAETAPTTVYYDRAIEDLTYQLSVLEEISNLDAETTEDLKRRIENLAENVDAAQPEAMLEAIDRLRDELGLEGQRRAELSQETMERFQAIGEQALGSSDLAQELMHGQLQEMLESGLMTDALSRVTELTPRLSELSSLIEANQLKLPEGFQLTQEQLEALSKLMQTQLGQEIGELDLAGLVNLEDLKLLAGKGGLAKLIESFHEHDEDCGKPGGT